MFPKIKSMWCIMQQGDATETEETCTTYNMLKVARYLFRWTGNVTYADYYERAITNALVGTQRMPEGGPAPSPHHAGIDVLTMPKMSDSVSASSGRYYSATTQRA